MYTRVCVQPAQGSSGRSLQLINKSVKKRSIVRRTVRTMFGDLDVHHHHHQSLSREGRWGTTDDFATSFLHFSLFSTALWDLPNSRHVHSLTLSSYLFRLPCLLPPFTVHLHSVCVSLRSSGDLRVVQLPAGSWHGLPRW